MYKQMIGLVTQQMNDNLLGGLYSLQTPIVHLAPVTSRDWQQVKGLMIGVLLTFPVCFT